MDSKFASVRPAPGRRRPRCETPIVRQDSDLESVGGVAGGDGGSNGEHMAIDSCVLRTIHEAQEEMERSTDTISDELENLRRDIRALSVEAQEGVGQTLDRETRSPKTSKVAVSSMARRKRSRVKSRSGIGEPSRLSPEDVRTLLTGLSKLQSEVEAEARVFQHRKGQLLSKHTALMARGGLEGGNSGRGCETDGREMVELEAEAQSLKANVGASHARLRERVQDVRRAFKEHFDPELRDLPRIARTTASMRTAASATTTSDNNSAGVSGTWRGIDAATISGRRSLDDLVDSAQAVLIARKEFEELKAYIEATRNDLVRETNLGRAARERTLHLELARRSAASAAGKAKNDACQSRIDAERTMRVLEKARSALDRARTRQHEVGEAVGLEEVRLDSLRREARELESRLQTAMREVEDREERAAVAAVTAEREEARLADCKDSFGLEVEGLQKGVGELESEAVGWRKALEQARSRLCMEEEQGRLAKARVEADIERLQEAAAKLRQEVQELEARVQAVRHQNAKESKRIARDTRAAAVELATLKPKIAEARSILRERHAELNRLTTEINEKRAGLSMATKQEASLEDRSAEAASHVARLEAEREQVMKEGEITRRQQEEELAHLTRAVARCRDELADSNKALQQKAVALEDQEREGKASLERIRQAQRDQEAAEARTQAALRAAREAAALAESSRNEAEREEARVIAAKARVAQAVDELRRHEAETESQKACLVKFTMRMEEARRLTGDVQAEKAQAQRRLAGLAGRRREEERIFAEMRQRAAALVQEEASSRAAADTARRNESESRDAVIAARNELTELLESISREKRVLEVFRDRGAALEADLARKREEDRFAREAADVQQARLDDIKREVSHLRDERLRVEKTSWALKGELETLSTKRDDAARRDRRREREEGALVARRDALAEAVAREEERLSRATIAKEAIEVELAELDTRVSALTSEANDASREASALREDAAAAANRAAGARIYLTTLEKDAAKMVADIEALRATKITLLTGVSGLRHEVEASAWSDRNRNGSAVNEREFATLENAGVGTRSDRVDTTSRRRARQATTSNRDDNIDFGGHADDEKNDWAGVGAEVGGIEVARKEKDPGTENPSKVVEVVTEFQGRLRKQVQAALASSARSGFTGGDTMSGSPSVTAGSDIDPLYRRSTLRVLGNATGPALRLPTEHVLSRRRRSCTNVLGELGRRVGSV